MEINTITGDFTDSGDFFFQIHRHTVVHLEWLDLKSSALDVWSALDSLYFTHYLKTLIQTELSDSLYQTTFKTFPLK